MKTEEWKAWRGRILRLWRKYQYFAAVILAGVALVLLPGLAGGSDARQEEETEGQTEEFDLTAFEQSVADKLSMIEGAGRVEVLLSLENGEESVYASEVSRSTQSSGGSGGSETYESTLPILSDGSYGESPVLVTSRYPTFRGAVIVCEGADDDAVRLQIVHAVSALCGISSDHISVSKLSEQEGEP